MSVLAGLTELNLDTPEIRSAAAALETARASLRVFEAFEVTAEPSPRRRRARELAARSQALTDAARAARDELHRAVCDANPTADEVDVRVTVDNWCVR